MILILAGNMKEYQYLVQNGDLDIHTSQYLAGVRDMWGRIRSNDKDLVIYTYGTWYYRQDAGYIIDYAEAHGIKVTGWK